MGLVKKILGLVLLFGGLIIILYSLYSSYNIFLAKTSPPEIFVLEEDGSVLPEGAQNLQAQMQKLIQEQLKGFLPTASISQLFNLIAWSIFASILILGGAQISGLGIKLLK